MKKNNLLKTVLLFLFAVFLLQGCRSENIMDTNKSEYTYTHIVSKEVKSLKDVPIFKAFIDDNKNEGQLKSLSKKISGENNIVVIIKKPNRVSYSTIILSGKNSFTILVYCIDDKNNKNAFLAEHNSKNELKEINLNNFTGNIFYKKMNGESLGKINMINGQPEITSRNTKTSTVDCYYEPTLTAIRCTAGGNHYPGQVCGGTADQQPYWDVSFLLKCQQTQDQLYNDIGGGDYGSGSNPALTLFGADAINYMLSQIGMTHLNPDQYSFLTSHPTIADYFKTFFWGGNQNIDGANFLYWGINFFMQNPNTTIEQFQKWFLDGYSAQYQSNLTKLSSPQLLAFVNINKEIDASPYQEEFVKETNEMFVAFGDIDNLTEAKMIAILMLINPQYVKAMENTRMIIATYNFNRKFYPEWSKARCFWEASRESIQYMLDLGGLIPVAGEICDLTNAAIYTINGDGLNATLSYVSAIPIAGWFSTGAKFGVKVVNKTASHIASRQVLKWILGTDGIIKFGYRSQLRKVLQLTDAAKQAHHIIPWEFANNAIVQKAAKSAEAFHMNDILNGIPLPTTGHLTGHNLYNDKLNQILTNLNNSNPNMSANQAYNHILALTNQIKTLIKNNPTYNLGQIASLIKYP